MKRRVEQAACGDKGEDTTSTNTRHTAKRQRKNQSKDFNNDPDAFDPITGFEGVLVPDRSSSSTSNTYQYPSSSSSSAHHLIGGSRVDDAEYHAGYPHDSDLSDASENGSIARSPGSEHSVSDTNDYEAREIAPFADEFDAAQAGDAADDEESRIEYISVPNPSCDVLWRRILKEIHQAGLTLEQVKDRCILCKHGIDNQVNKKKTALTEMMTTRFNEIHKLYIRNCHLYSYIPFEQMAARWNARTEIARAYHVQIADFPALKAWEIAVHYLDCRMDIVIEKKKRIIHILERSLNVLLDNGLFAKRCCNGVVSGNLLLSTKGMKIGLELFKTWTQEQTQLSNMITQAKTQPVSTSILPHPRRDGLRSEARPIGFRR